MVLYFIYLCTRIFAYIRKVWKGTTATERVSVLLLLILTMFCISIIVYYEVKIARMQDGNDEFPWFIERSKWYAKEPRDRLYTTEYEPVRLVVIHHTETPECRDFVQCASYMKDVQQFAFGRGEDDTPYNFFIGNDGRVYEGRGWGVQGEHIQQFNPCALLIGFFGDYRLVEDGGYSQVTETQLNNTLRLLNQGIQAKRVHEDYVVAGARDLVTTSSPGYYLYNAVQKWKHFNGTRYREYTCDQIHGLESADNPDLAPHEWLISREMWDAGPFQEPNTYYDRPLRLVLVQHSVTNECQSFGVCKTRLHALQTFGHRNGENIAYNYIIGGDGRAYEARGWGVDGGRSQIYEKCSYTIGFLGDYRPETANTQVTEDMMNRTQMILDEGVRLGYLHPDYVVVGARDMFPSLSPGDNLYYEIQNLPHYDLRYQGMSCDEIDGVIETTPAIEMTEYEMGTSETETFEKRPTDAVTIDMGSSETGTSEIGTNETATFDTTESGISEKWSTEISDIVTDKSESGIAEAVTVELETAETETFETETSETGIPEAMTAELNTPALGD